VITYACCWIVGTLGLVHQEATEISVGDVARIEVRVDDVNHFVGEVFEVSLHFGLRESFLRDHILQTFHNELDVAVQLDVPWWAEVEGATLLGEVDPEVGSSFVLNGRLARRERSERPVHDGFVEFQIERRMRAERAGNLAFARAALTFEYATRFRETFLDGRVPLDKTSARLTSEPLAIRIRELPVLGRPAEFSGAVGKFSIRGEASTNTVRVGEPLEWTITIEGRGNLNSFEAQQLEKQLADFHVLGRIEKRLAGKREFVYELVPLRELEAVPSIDFAFFDPDLERYRTVRTESIALTVQPKGDGVELPRQVPVKAASVSEGPARDGSPADSPVERTDIGALKTLAAPSLSITDERLSSTQLIGVLSAPWLLWLAASVWLSRRARRKEDLDGCRARAAAAAFQEQTAARSVSLREAYAEFVAARLRCSGAAVVAPGLAQRLVKAGVPTELAEQSATALGELLDERFGGRAGSIDPSRTATPDSVRALVERLEEVFARLEAST